MPCQPGCREAMPREAVAFLRDCGSSETHSDRCVVPSDALSVARRCAWTHSIVLAQMAGSWRGDLGAYGGGDYVQLRDYLLENPVTKVQTSLRSPGRARGRCGGVVCAGQLTDCAYALGKMLSGWR